MIIELVDMAIKPSLEAAFETAFAPAAELIRRSKGCESVRLLHGIEHPNRYRVVVQWQALENHTEDFRGSPDHRAFLEQIAPYVDRANSVPPEHHTIVVEI